MGRFFGSLGEPLGKVAKTFAWLCLLTMNHSPPRRGISGNFKPGVDVWKLIRVAWVPSDY